MSGRHAPSPGAFRRTLRLLRPHLAGSRLLAAGGVAVIGAEVAARLLEPWPVSWVIDIIGARMLTGPGSTGTGEAGASWAAGLSSPALLAVAGAAVAAVAALRAGAAYLSALAFAHVGARVSARLRSHVHARLLAAHPSFHAGSRSGDLVNRVVSDVARIQEAGVSAGMPMIANVATVLGMVCVVLVLDPVLGAIALIVLPVLLLSGRAAGARITAASRSQRQREGELAGDAAEAFGAITTVQAYGLGDHLSARFRAADRKGLGAGVRARQLAAGLERRTDLIVGIATGFILAAGGWRVLSGAITLGELVVFITYLKTTFKPLRDVAKHTGRIARAAASGERIADTLEEAQPPAQPSWARDLPAAQAGGDVPAPLPGRIELRALTAGYDPARPVLRAADLVVDAGERVAIVGPSGAGKSTLLALLLRFASPSSGQILIDGHDAAGLTAQSIREAIAVVLQDSAVLSGTLAENVRLGRLSASDEEVEEALRQAGLGEVIDAHPDGIHREAGERGVTLSGGQRQRLAVARAMVRRPRIVLLDEPSTGLDAVAVEALADALQRLCAGRTTLLVTHDERLLRLANRVVELGGGRLRERPHPLAAGSAARTGS